MNKAFSILVVGLLLVGCGKYSPTAPKFGDVSLDTPPVVYLSFNDTMKTLKTWAHVVAWWRGVGATYNYSMVGWGDSSPGSKTDNAYNLAYHLWEQKERGVGGVCGNFAGFFVVAMRTQGFQTGGITYFYQQHGVIEGHIEAWVVTEDGSVVVISNDVVERRFPSLKSMKRFYDEKWGGGQGLYYSNNLLCHMTEAEMIQTFGEEKYP